MGQAMALILFFAISILGLVAAAGKDERSLEIKTMRGPSDKSNIALSEPKTSSIVSPPSPTTIHAKFPSGPPSFDPSPARQQPVQSSGFRALNSYGTFSDPKPDPGGPPPPTENKPPQLSKNNKSPPNRKMSRVPGTVPIQQPNFSSYGVNANFEEICRQAVYALSCEYLQTRPAYFEAYAVTTPAVECKCNFGGEVHEKVVWAHQSGNTYHLLHIMGTNGYGDWLVESKGTFSYSEN